MLAPKGLLGELGGGHLAAAVLLASGNGTWPAGPAPGFRTVDPELGLAPHGGALPPARAGRPYRVLVQTVAAGGGAAWLILERPAAAAPHPGRKAPP